MSMKNGLIGRLVSNKYLLLASRFVLGFVFIYASIDKISHPGAFADIIANYRILPGFVTNIVAIVLPWVELICGLSLVVGLFLRTAAVLVTALLTLFLASLLTSVIRGLDISCGCFTVTTDAAKVGPMRLAEDILMILMSLHIAVFGTGFAAVETYLSELEPTERRTRVQR
jgi:uncharacterized membrane protein YphA (DoxX/SURF4 family)